MIEVVGIRFKKAGKMYYFDPAGIKLEKEDGAIVETARGIEYGTVIKGNSFVPEKKDMVKFFDALTGTAQMLIFFLLGLLVTPLELPEVFLPSLLIFLFMTLVGRWPYLRCCVRSVPPGDRWGWSPGPGCGALPPSYSPSMWCWPEYRCSTPCSILCL